MTSARHVCLTAALTLGLGFVQPDAAACTRVLYSGDDQLVMTARSMDWTGDVKSNLWAFPRGLQRDGQSSHNPVHWTSKYGSVITSAYDKGTTDGMNEKGLVANLLWLTESEYPADNGRKPTLSVAMWPQFVLDNYATVQEAVDALKAERFIVTSGAMPEDPLKATLHLAISDASGDSAIFEYIKGKLVIHHDRAYTVMTNSPPFEQQLALNTYWKSIGGDVMLPGTERASDRFARASYYINLVPKSGEARSIAASVLSVIRDASTPLVVAPAGKPTVWPTLWRTVSDQKNRIYYFESATTSNSFWVDLKALDLSQGAPTRKLDMSGARAYAADATSRFEAAKPFTLR